jgi:hypothetical protein
LLHQPGNDDARLTADRDRLVDHRSLRPSHRIDRRLRITDGRLHEADVPPGRTASERNDRHGQQNDRILALLHSLVCLNYDVANSHRRAYCSSGLIQN